MSRIPNSDLAFAYELRHEGVSWKWIGRAMGIDWRALKDDVESAERGGLSDKRIVISAEQLKATQTMRDHGLGYGSIARYLGVDRQQLQYAMWNRNRQQRRLAAKQKENQ